MRGLRILAIAETDKRCAKRKRGHTVVYSMESLKILEMPAGTSRQIVQEVSILEEKSEKTRIVSFPAKICTPLLSWRDNFNHFEIGVKPER